jgi:hypothetical protein
MQAVAARGEPPNPRIVRVNGQRRAATDTARKWKLRQLSIFGDLLAALSRATDVGDLFQHLSATSLENASLGNCGHRAESPCIRHGPSPAYG